MDCNLLGASVHGTLQARILEWVAIPFSRRSSWPRDWNHVSCTAGRFLTTEPPGNSTLWTVACQVPLSMGLSRPEYWSGLPWPPPGDLPDPGIKPASPATSASQVNSLPRRQRRRACHLLIVSYSSFSPAVPKTSFHSCSVWTGIQTKYIYFLKYSCLQTVEVINGWISACIPFWQMPRIV